MSSLHEKLQANAEKLKNISLNQLFEQEQEQRLKDWTFEVAGIYADLSKHHINWQTKALWKDLVEQKAVFENISATIRGELVNVSEHRPALHHVLRADAKDVFMLDDVDINAEIRLARERMKQVSEHIHNGDFSGANGEKFSDIVHIGIGGSEVGPRMLCELFAHQSDRNIKVHFLATTDPRTTQQLCKNLNPNTTLLIIASKTFSTEETLTNAQIMRNWLRENLGSKADQQMIALSANVKKAAEFGIAIEKVLPFWDWVGGRYSLWSAISLPFIIQNGYEAYLQLLKGANKMDYHYQNAPFNDNLPMQLALLDYWNNIYLQINNRAVIPYCDGLSALPQYLQQLEMESLGKSTSAHGDFIDIPAGSIVWGGCGSQSQHAFFQLIHQGKYKIPLDFIAIKNAPNGFEESSSIMQANCIAQAQALMKGKSFDEMDKNLSEKDKNQRFCPGNHASSFFLLDNISPEVIGAFIALFEHKTAVLACLYGVNPYDQWGVELGKHLAKSLRNDLKNKEISTKHDISTQEILRRILQK